MDLATHQRKLLGLFRCSYQPSVDDDAHIRSVALSRIWMRREEIFSCGGFMCSSARAFSRLRCSSSANFCRRP